MYRTAEVIEHGARAANLDARAMNQACMGHYGKAAALETRADIQRAEMMGAAMRPYPVYRSSAAVIAAETAMMAGAVVKGAVVADEMRRVREAEMIAAATRPIYPVVYPSAPTNIYVQPAYPSYPAGGYPGTSYPSSSYPSSCYPSSPYAPGYGSPYPPAAGYPPPGGYPGYPPY